MCIYIILLVDILERMSETLNGNDSLILKGGLSPLDEIKWSLWLLCADVFVNTKYV